MEILQHLSSYTNLSPLLNLHSFRRLFLAENMWHYFEVYIDAFSNSLKCGKVFYHFFAKFISRDLCSILQRNSVQVHGYIFASIYYTITYTGLHMYYNDAYIYIHYTCIIHYTHIKTIK